MGELRAEDSERWKTDGNCFLCRRYTYCSKPCKAQRARRVAILSQFEAGRAQQQR